jgi:signal transduction histidine kinase
VAPMKYTFFQGGGEMGERAASFPWEDTSLGSPDQWPQSLKTALSIVLRSKFPMFLWWGKDLIQFYNDAYLPGLGNDGMHPAIFGRRAADSWPDAWNIIEPLIRQVLQGESVFFEDMVVPNMRNGQLVDTYWTFSYSPVVDDMQQVAGVIVCCIETTEKVLSMRKLKERSELLELNETLLQEKIRERTAELESAHQSLLAANQYLQNIINLCKEPIQVLQPVYEGDTIVDFRFALTNAAYASYAGTTPAELYGKRVGDVFPGYFETSSFTKVVEVFITGIAQTWEIHYEADGLNLHNLMSATRMNDEVVVYFTDFTAMKNLQLELMLNIGELERSNQHLEEFAHAASHDLKEPIRKVKVFTGQLRKKMDHSISREENDLLDRIESASDRMGLLVEDLLQYSHVSHVPREKDKIDLNDVVAQVLQDLDLDIQESGTKLNVGRLPVINGYRRQLQQMFQNLISNAIKYRRASVPPQIDISCRTREIDFKKYYEISISDNGIGFDPQYAEKIFHMFTRLHSKAEYSGTGVGLSIVKKVVENHKGFITATSEPGKGSTFTIQLPA